MQITINTDELKEKVKKIGKAGVGGVAKKVAKRLLDKKRKRAFDKRAIEDKLHRLKGMGQMSDMEYKKLKAK